MFLRRAHHHERIESLRVCVIGTLRRHVAADRCVNRQHDSVNRRFDRIFFQQRVGDLQCGGGLLDGIFRRIQHVLADRLRINFVGGATLVVLVAGGFQVGSRQLHVGARHGIVDGEQQGTGRHRLALVHQNLCDRAGNFRIDIDVFPARLVALDNAIGIDGRLIRAADRLKHRRLRFPLPAKKVSANQSGQNTDDRKGKDDFVSESRLGLGWFGFRFRLGSFCFRLGFRFRWHGIQLRLSRFCFKRGFRFRHGCCRLHLSRFDFRFRLGGIHSVPLSAAERWPSSMWRIRSAYSLMRASWVTIRMQRL